MTEQFMTVADVAEALGVAKNWVYDHAAELGAVRLGDAPNAGLRFEATEIRRWLNSHRLIAA